jgi:hypothetical protein
MEWFEELPDQCPPKEAKNPNKETYYRIVGNDPPQTNDFYSNSKLFPNKDYSRIECQARALSVSADKKDCETLVKLPNFKGKMIAELILNSQDGVVLYTPSHSNKSHYSWWRSLDFSFSNCNIIN